MNNPTNKIEIIEYATPAESIKGNSDFILKTARQEVADKGFFTFVLSGGNTPKTLYESLASPAYAGRMPWQHTYIFWGDERCVEPDHPDSNFGMTRQAMLSKIDIPAENIFRMPAEVKPREEAAIIYEKKLAAFFKGKKFSQAVSPSQIPAFDLVLLGMGEDGHTASLFPDSASLTIKDRWVTTVPPGNTSPLIPRLTLTLPILNNANSVLFMILGKAKQQLARQIINNQKAVLPHYPAALIQPRQRLIWSMV